MKRILIALLALCMMFQNAMAIGRVIQSGEEVQPTAAPVAVRPELKDWLGSTRDEFSAYVKSLGEGVWMPRVETVYVESEGEGSEIIVEISDWQVEGFESVFSLMGLYIGYSFEDPRSLLTANGWEEVSSFIEGYIMDWTFEKKVGDSVYTFRFWTDGYYDDCITYLSLKVDDIEAHYANEGAGLEPLLLECAAE